ncbi:fucose-binding lectin II [Levilactobacillus yiduensis]|uniref:fucose-binding lectin II n=1 Tax=Levilactobacillus yiduensis TaxID=2953880 RepID=UPI000EF2F8FA|nr:fucose-binding lectin II [Levilactobacillus yiduensis]AYM02391.1 fucose-binding lectin II [Levilactobacillus brevis]
MLNNKLIAASLTAVMALGAVVPVMDVNAASVKVASKKSQKSKQKALYTYAKKMMKQNKDGVNGKAKIFSKSAYPTTGAAAGYSDFLLGLKKQGYKFTKANKKLIKKNLVINSKSDPATLATAIIGLQAVGLNPTKYKPAGAKKNMNLVNKLYKESMTKQTVNVQSQALVAVSSNKTFKKPSKAKFSKNSLSLKIAKNKQSNNGWSYNNTVASVDSDTTAAAVNAMMLGKSKNKTVKKAEVAGRNYLKKNIYKSGAFGFTYAGKENPNANSTAEGILALSTTKTSFKFVNKKAIKKGQTATPLKAMFSYVKADGSIKDAYSMVLAYGQVSVAASAAHNGVYTKKLVYSFK